MNLSKYPFKGTRSERNAFMCAIVKAYAEGKQIERRRIGVKNGKWSAVPMSAITLDVNEWYYRVKPFVPAPFDFNKFPLNADYSGFSIQAARPPKDWVKLDKSEIIKAGDIIEFSKTQHSWACGVIGTSVSVPVYRRPAPFNYVVFPIANPKKDTAVKIAWGETSDKRRVPSIPSDWKLVESGEIKAGDIYMPAGSVPEWVYGLIGDSIDSVNCHNQIWRRPAPVVVPKPFDYDKFPKTDNDPEYSGSTGKQKNRTVPSIPTDWVLLDKSEIIKPGDIVRLSASLEWAYGYIGEKIPRTSSNVAYRRPAKLHNPDRVKLDTPTVYRLLTVEEIELPQNESTEWYGSIGWSGVRGWIKPAFLDTKKHSSSNTYRTHLSVAEYAKASAEAIKPKATTTYWNFDTVPKVWLLLRSKTRPTLNYIIRTYDPDGVLTGGGDEVSYRELGDQYEYTTDGKTWKNCLTVL